MNFMKKLIWAASVGEILAVSGDTYRAGNRPLNIE